MSEQKAAKEKRSIRTTVMVTMGIGFVCMFILLYFIFSTSMQSMLVGRESDNMAGQADLARNMLLSSVDFVPNVTQDWAYWDNMYDYAAGESDEVYQTHLSESYAFEMFKLNIMTVLDADGNVLFERFYQYDDHAYVENGPDLRAIYTQLEDMIKAEYRDDLEDYGVLGEAGFFSRDGDTYYLSAKPILHSGLVDQEMGPLAGIFIFGRIIDAEELSDMMQDGSQQFTVVDIAQTALTADEQTTLEETGRFMRLEGDSAVVYGGFTDIFGEDSLLVAIESDRNVYAQGRAFISLIVLFVALGCLLVLAAIINLLDRFVLRPLGSLVFDVNGIDMDNVNQGLEREDNNKEMTELTGAINNMLSRIRKDRDLIRQSNESLYYNANYDILTGLRNRINISRTLTNAIDQAREERTPITVFYFDLDRFKYVNDTLGHQMGDNLIIQIADRLRAKLGKDTRIARMGGDEFMVWLPNIGSEQERNEFAARIDSVFSDAFIIKERELDISASIGSSVFPEDGEDSETLIKNAEIAMYRAKEKGDHIYICYQREFHNSLQRRIYIENKLRAVIGDGCREFRAYFQPKVSVDSGKIESCEALIRWLSPEGLIGPLEFIPQAEESGLIVPLTWWMIRECCKQSRRFAEDGMPMNIAINVPAQVLMHDDFLGVLQSAAAEEGVDVRSLEIEITEGTLLEDMEKVNDVFDALHTLGIEVSVDDFGTGYSSLSYLNRLAVDRIKVDRSFVSGIGKDEDSRAIVRAIVAMAKSLHMVVTAEGVEDGEQYAFLRGIHCEEVQGYLISRPVPGDQFIDFVNEWRGDDLVS